MKCQRCSSTRVASISSKSSDLNNVWIGDASRDGYVPGDMGIGSGDYVSFEWCLNCGQIQDTFPLPFSELEEVESEEKYEWYACDAQTGIADSIDDAFESLQKCVDYDLNDAELKYGTINVLDDTLYYYQGGTSDEEIDKDDGAYTPRITKLENNNE